MHRNDMNYKHKIYYFWCSVIRRCI